MNSNTICFASVADLTAAFRAGELSAVDIVNAYADRAEASTELNAYLHLDRSGALASAEALDQARASGHPLGPLAGVVIGLKDALCATGTPTTAGSKMLEGWISPYDATAVTRLRAADAIILGKLNMDEFAMGSSNEASAYGACRNPWDQSRVPGGSSGGSAAAVAAGLCTVALGSDTGGSIRQPAGFCGVVGVKPTYGRVSRFGLIAFASSLDCVGPLARRVADAARVLEVISGCDPRDATSMDAEPLRLADTDEADIAGLTIGIPTEYFPDSLNEDVGASVRDAIATLEAAGAAVRDISLPHTRYALACYYIVSAAEASSNLARFDGVRYGARADDSKTLTEMYSNTRALYFGAEVKRRILLGTFALRTGYVDDYYVKAQKVRRLIKGDFEAAWASGIDLIATPTSPTTAFPIGSVSTPLEMYLADLFTLSTNLAGLPGISVPASPVEGMPVGFQLLAPAGSEALMFRAASAFESARPWRLGPDSSTRPGGDDRGVGE